MDMGEAIRQLDALPYHWTAGKGRVRANEPLWGVQLFRVFEDGISDASAVMMTVEGDSLDYCVTRAVAWHKQQAPVDYFDAFDDVLTAHAPKSSAVIRSTPGKK
jgi:hypothetical protein